MSKQSKSVGALTVEDLQAFAVWRFTGSDTPEEDYVEPVMQTPVSDLHGMVVGAEVILSNAERRWALIGNVDVDDAKATEHFACISIACNGSWFHLARYHDFDIAERGPAALAHALGLGVGEVFPIHYDISAYARGEPAALCGHIQAAPRVRLSREDLIDLAVG